MKRNKKILCRVCLQCDLDNDRVSSIFDESDKGFIYEKLNYIADVQIKPSDGLPDKICAECLMELENAINFKHKCETSNSILVSAASAADALKGEETAVEETLVEDVKEEPDEYSETEYLDEEPASPTELSLKAEEPEIQLPDSHETYFDPPSRPSKAVDLQLECHDCGNLFKSKCKLKVHWFKVHLKTQLTCQTCRKRFGSFQSLKKHKLNRPHYCIVLSEVNVIGEGKYRKFHCKQCKYSTTHTDSIVKHMVTHTGERNYRCKLCPKVYSQYAGLQMHMERKHNGTKDDKVCKICGKNVKGYYEYCMHMRKHRISLIPCEICNKMIRKTNIRTHMETHTTDRLFSCDICAATFKTGTTLMGHKRVVHDKKIYKYNCNMCTYTTRDSATIKRHKERHLEQKLPCAECGKFFDNEKQLSLHMEKHTNRNVACPHCDSKFHNRKRMLSHMNKVHNLYVAYKPPHC